VEAEDADGVVHERVYRDQVGCAGCLPVGDQPSAGGEGEQQRVEGGAGHRLQDHIDPRAAVGGDHSLGQARPGAVDGRVGTERERGAALLLRRGEGDDPAGTAPLRQLDREAAHPAGRCGDHY
jgi:hypothetical protein